jgi:hypothetical protein
MSQTATILAHLATLPKDSTFTTTDLLKDVKDVSVGAVTGLMARLVKLHGAEIVAAQRVGGRGRLSHVYRVKNLSRVGTRENPKKRRKYKAKAKPAVVSNTPNYRQQAVDGLMDIAAKLESMRFGLADYSVDELLAEVRRRAS